MGLFTFSDLRFKTAARSGFGVNGKLVGNSTYDTKLTRYPIDLGDSDKGHYIIIHINEQVKTRFPGEPGGDTPTVLLNGGIPPLYSAVNSSVAGAGKALDKVQETLNKFTNGASSSLANKAVDLIGQDTINNLKGFLGKLGSSATGGRDLNQVLSQGARTIRRTSETIALYMPDTLAFNFNQQYSSLNLNDGLTPALVSAVASIVDEKGNLRGDNEIFKNLTPFGVNLAAKATGSNFLQAGATAVLGVVQNPQLEMLYTSPQFRNFRFDFVFYPRSEAEARSVQSIIDSLRYHQAPEIAAEGAGFFLVPPSEFDIKFYYNGKENPNIPKISTCVLSGIDLDFAPNGFAAYEVPGQTQPSVGGTGMPVAIRMGLSFQETQVFTKANYRHGAALSNFPELRTPAEIKAGDDLKDFYG